MIHSRKCTLPDCGISGLFYFVNPWPMQERREQEQRLRALELRAALDRARADPHTAIGITGESTTAGILDLLAMLKE